MPIDALANLLAPADNLPAPAKRERPISPRIRQVIDLLTNGTCKTQKAAAERVGLHPDYVCRMLKTPQVRVFAEQEARKSVAAGVMRASARLTELLDASSEAVSFDATRLALGISGIKPSPEPQVSFSLELKAGYVISLEERAEDRHDRRVGPTIEAVRAHE